eukprot:8960474-Pyramimonas_sp.AAC.1
MGDISMVIQEEYVYFGSTKVRSSGTNLGMGETVVPRKETKKYQRSTVKHCSVRCLCQQMHKLNGSGKKGVLELTGAWTFETDDKACEIPFWEEGEK